VFLDSKLEKTPLKQTQQFKPRHSYPVIVNQLSPTEEEKFEEVIHKLRAQAEARRTMIKPVFQDFDRLRKERVTRTQFQQVLDTCRFKLSTEEVELLYQKFGDERNDVDYISFCKQVEVPMGTSYM
jgi:Ca2+-binding EF-hand superfamily protein